MASSAWNDFYKLSTLTIQFHKSPGSSTASIFGNGNNQVAVAVQVKIVDSSGNALSLTASDLQNVIYLCNYTDGSDLPSSWSVSNSAGDYSEPLSYAGSTLSSVDTLATSSTVTVVKYISASALSTGQSIAAGINIPGVGAFDTSKNGTSTLNGPEGASGSVFKSAGYVTVAAKQSIDLNDISNFTIKNQTTDFDTIVSNMKVYIARYNNTSYDSVSSNYEGKSYKNNFQIHLSSGYAFRHKTVYKPSSYGTLFGGSATFNVNEPDIYCGLSPDDHYHIGMVTIDKAHYGVSHTNNFTAQRDTNYASHTYSGIPLYRNRNLGELQWYHIGTSDSRHKLTASISEDYIYVGYLEFWLGGAYLMPVNKNTKITYWTEEPSRDYAYVRVADVYGNHGTLKFTFNPDTYPSVKVETYSGDSWKG